VTPDGKFLVVSNGYAPDDMRRSFAAKAGPAAIPPTALQLFDLASGKSLKTVPVPGDVQGTIRFIRPDKLGAWAQAESPARGGAAEGDLLPQAQAGTLDIARDEKAPLEFGPPITVAPRVDVTSDPVAVNLKVFSYLFAPAEIRVYTGARVRVLLTNIDERGAFTRDEDVVHGFCINGYGPQTNVVVPKGTTAAFTFTADKPGAYVFYCSRSCGPMHRMMRGRFIVE
jgi:plastocyanin